ncbi:arabinose-5-phosphate isomerase GutQ [Candidatus Blochmanniella camponoti]|uniref:Arabinose 5-phosphate isomerase n=1 Tax=Candidatus Blochmanniella camponoti TaxID=108080 RepID=A0AAE9L6Q4_9ENTR|nr:arabinose-5-phosphate isomerase GutQ [Candidatus Blochmannia herculeanus]URJ27655.1 arabinose-5-phosphate isomerase GutQ [Candidatus Blochmannia herculeanus]
MVIINDALLLEYAKETLEIEINEAQRMLDRLDESIVFACRMLLDCTGKVAVSGIGKSGHIGKKIAASLASTGTPAFFVHPAEALHGDLGMIGTQDVVMFISYSGRACEIITLMPLLADSGIPVIAFTGDISSPLAKGATCVLNIKIQREACPMELSPTSSAVNTLMMGDALTMALMRHRGFSLEQFARSHPGGRLGAQLLNCVHHLMRTGDQISKVFWKVTVMDAMFELSRTGLGLTAVCDNYNCVTGVFTDGDLRRWIVQGKSLNDPVDIAMTKPGYCIPKEWRASIALQALHQRKITAAPVVDKLGRLVGSINMYDLHQAGIE